MDKTKSPGIAIEHISLVDAEIKLNPDFDSVDKSKQLHFNLQLTNFVRIISPEDGSRLLVSCSFDVMHGIEKPFFYFTCTFCAQYVTVEEEKNMAWSEFTDVMATAHIIPFLREFVSNMTNRLPNAPPLMLSPVNVAVLIGNYQRQIVAREEA